MSGDEEDRGYHFRRVPRKTYTSRDFPSRDPSKMLRYAYKVIDDQGGAKFATIEDEVVLHNSERAYSD